MNNALTVGIAKGIKPALVKLASEELEAGEYTINEIVRITGTVRKGEEYEQIIHMSVPQWNLIAVLFSKLNGITVDSVVREMLDVTEEQVTAIKAKAQEALDKIKAPAKEMVAGKVTTKLAFSVVGSQQEKEAVKAIEAVNS